MELNKLFQLKGYIKKKAGEKSGLIGKKKEKATIFHVSAIICYA